MPPLISYAESLDKRVLEDAKIAEAQKKTTKIYATIEHEKGREEARKESVLKPYKKGRTAVEISDFLDIPIEQVLKIVADYEQSKNKIY